MRQSSKLIVNTAIVYTRMCIGLVVGLLLTRELLGELGEIDYGLFLSVGAAWALLNIFLGSLNSSGQRHLAHALGTEDHRTARRTFSCLCLANWALSASVFLVGLLASSWILNGIEVPVGRETAAAYVYWVGLTALTLTLVMVPFTAAMLANQQFMAIAVFELIERFCALAAVYAMQFYAGDKLIYWAIIFAALQISFGVSKVLYAAWKLPWVRFVPSDTSWSDSKEILFFASWMLISSSVFKVRMQGTLLIFNIFFGNAVAAAQGVTMQLAMYQNQITASLTQTVRPMLTGQVARGDQTAFRSLSLTYSKFTSLASGLIAILLLAETEALLSLWLKKVPPYSEEIVWWTILLFLFNRLSVGYMVAMQAKGDLAGVTLYVQLPELIFLIPMIGYLTLFPGEPWHVPAGFLVVNVVLTLVVLPIYVGRLIGLSAAVWAKQVALPVLLLFPLAYFAVWSLRLTGLPDLPRVIIGEVVNVAVLAFGGWYWVLNEQERSLIATFVNAARQKLRSVARGTSEPGARDAGRG